MTRRFGWIGIALAVLCATQVLAIDLPMRKSGLWEMKVTRDASGGRPPETVQMCIDQKTDDLAQQMGANVAKDACSKRDIRREGSKVVADSVCKIGETTATSHSVFTGGFETAYRGEIRTRYSPPLADRKDSLTIIEARWSGPCKADQKPGDMIMPNGMKINIKQISGQP